MSKKHILRGQPHVLFISYYFPPTNNVAGSIRSELFVKHLPDYGWKPTVLSLAEGKIEQKDHKAIHIHSLLPKTKRFHLTPYGWIGPAIAKSLRLLRQEPCDAIYITLPPFPIGIAVLLLSKLSKVPIVLDLRDAWTLGPYQKNGFIDKIVHRWIYPWLERSLFHSAAAIILNTPSAHKAYKEAYPFVSDRLHYIPNGYSETDFMGITEPPRQDPDTFILLHCGAFGVSGRDPQPILGALKSTLALGHKIILRVIGQTSDQLIKLAEQYAVAQCIEISPPLSHRKAIEAQINCDALLLYQAHSTASTSAIAGKTFEYIRIGKPILAVTPEGDNRSLVKEHSGFFAIAESIDANTIKAALIRLVTAKKEGTLPRMTPPKGQFAQRFERKQLTGQLATVLDKSRIYR